MEKNKAIATVCFVEHSLGGRGWGNFSPRGGEAEGEGEPKRKRVLCRNIPEALSWLFSGQSLGELERLVYAWAGGGAGDSFEARGKFLQKNDCWLGDLEVKVSDAGEGAVWDDEVGKQDEAYAEDVLSYLGISGGGKGRENPVS